MIKTSRSKKLLVLAISAATCLTAALAESSVGLKFAGDRSIILPGESCGVVPQMNWNNLPGASGSSDAVVDAQGNKTPIKVEWDVAELWMKGNKSDDPDERLLKGWLDGGAGGRPASIEITGVPYKSYTLYIYFTAGETARTSSTYKINGNAIWVIPGSFKDGLKPAVQMPDRTFDPDKQGTYLEIPDQSGDVSIETENDGWQNDKSRDFRSPVSAIQIVDTSK